MAEPKRKLFILTICSACFSLASSLLNIEELQSVKYGLEILNKPVLLKESTDLDDTVVISSKYGQQYQCELPAVVINEGQAEERKSITTEEITTLIEPMRNSKCLYHNKGWWTYEFCFGKIIQQYHEEGGQIIGEKTTLGVYGSQTDWSQEKLEGSTNHQKKVGVKRYHSHKYINGSKCEVTGKPREALVKFFCERGERDYVSRVDEPASCSYIITVQTAKLCNHSLFAPPPSQKPKQITCSPALPQEHYNKYLKNEEIKKKTAEAKKNSKPKARLEKIKANRDPGMSSSERSKNKRVKSLLWPWEDAVEADDMLVIEGNVEKNKIGVSRLDLMRDRRREGEQTGMTMATLRSHSTNREDFSRPKSEANEENPKESDEKVLGVLKKEASSEPNIKDEIRVSSPSYGPKQSDAETVVDKASNGKEKSDKGKEKKKLTLQQSRSENLEKDALKKAYSDIKNVVWKNLRDLGVDPDEMEKTFHGKHGAKLNVKEDNEMIERSKEGNLKELRQQVTKGLGKDVFGLKAAVDERLGKLTEMIQGMEKDGKLQQESKEKDALSNVRKVLKELDSHNALLMKKEKVIQSALQKQFDNVRQQTRSRVATVKEMVAEIEDYYKQTGVKSTGKKETVGRIKEAMKRFEDTNRELDYEMAAVRRLHDEIQNKVTKMLTNFMKGDVKLGKEFFHLAAKANVLLGKLLERSAKLDQEMQDIRNIGKKLSKRADESAKEKRIVDISSVRSTSNKLVREYKMDKVIHKLKTLIKDLDKGSNYQAEIKKDLPKIKDTLKINNDLKGQQQASKQSDVDTGIKGNPETERRPPSGRDLLSEKQETASSPDNGVKKEENTDSQSIKKSQSNINKQSDMESHTSTDDLVVEKQEREESKQDKFSQSEIDSHLNTESHADIESHSVTDSLSDIDRDLDTDSQPDMDMDSQSDMDSHSDLDSHSDIDSHSDMDSQLDMDSQTVIDSHSDMDSQAVIDSHSDMDSQSDMDSHSDMDQKSDGDSHMQPNAALEKNEDFDSSEKYRSSKSDVMDDVADDRIKIRVRHMHSDDEKELADEEMNDSDQGGEGDMEEMGTESRIKRATRKMEQLVKEQLKDAGIIPKGKVRVKILTNRDAIRQFGDQGGGMQILSEQETNQFKDMIMSLLGGSQEAGRERRRQLELESNYNLVWNKDKGFTSAQEKEQEQDDLDSHFIDE